MWISEQLLYFAAKALYRTEVAQTKDMKAAKASAETYGAFRSTTLPKILTAAKRYGVPIAGTVLDFGCADGAISPGYLEAGAAKVIGIDIKEHLIAKARERHPHLEFHVSTPEGIPLPDESVDTIICYDVFEHVSQPAAMLRECRRVLKPRGKMLIGTWGWKHPFAPHLFAVMPVPWAHCLVSERTLLRVCRRVYHSPWYVPNMHDLDEHGQKQADRYNHDTIPTSYVNKLLIRDFERVFRESELEWVVHPQPFGSARWTRVFLWVPFIREYLTSYLWAVLTKPPIP